MSRRVIGTRTRNREGVDPSLCVLLKGEDIIILQSGITMTFLLLLMLHSLSYGNNAVPGGHSVYYTDQKMLRCHMYCMLFFMTLMKTELVFTFSIGWSLCWTFSRLYSVTPRVPLSGSEVRHAKELRRSPPGTKHRLPFRLLPTVNLYRLWA